MCKEGPHSEGAEVPTCQDRNEVGMCKGWSWPGKLQNGKKREWSWKASFIYRFIVYL